MSRAKNSTSPRVNASLRGANLVISPLSVLSCIRARSRRGSSPPTVAAGYPTVKAPPGPGRALTASERLAENHADVSHRSEYHPTMETRAFAGEIVDVMYCNHNNRERWFESGLIRAVDDLPGADELKKKMSPANLDSLKSKDGSKLVGLPYFTSLFILIYNEPMLQQAGIKAPAKSWDELVEHSMKLKKDKISDTPYLPNWNNSPSGTMPQFMSDCFSEGAQVFDAKNRVIVDQEPGAAKAMERWQKVYKAELVNPEVLTKTSSTDTHRLFWTGRYAYHTNHSYYLKTIAGEPENSKLAPKKAKMTM